MPGATHLVPFIDDDKIVDTFALQRNTGPDSTESSADHRYLVIWLCQFSRR
ncbi:MAG: hypothetical protein ACRDDJ_13930 [[Mycobacterium] stephanolepidis]